MTPEDATENELAIGIRSVLSKFKSNTLSSEQAEAEILSLVAPSNLSAEADGITGLRTHD